MHDASGNGHDGTFNGGWDTGKVNGAGTFNGNNDAVSVPAHSDFTRPAGASLTISAWVMRTGSLSHDFVLSSGYGASSATFGMEVESDSILTYWDGQNHAAESSITFPANTWHHMALTVSAGASVTIYFDGVAIGSGACDGTPRTQSYGVMLGSSNYGQHWPGKLDQVRYYKRALSPAEVVADMNN